MVPNSKSTPQTLDYNLNYCNDNYFQLNYLKAKFYALVVVNISYIILYQMEQQRLKCVCVCIINGKMLLR